MAHKLGTTTDEFYAILEPSTGLWVRCHAWEGNGGPGDYRVSTFDTNTTPVLVARSLRHAEFKLKDLPNYFRRKREESIQIADRFRSNLTSPDSWVRQQAEESFRLAQQQIARWDDQLQRHFELRLIQISKTVQAHEI